MTKNEMMTFIGSACKQVEKLTTKKLEGAMNLLKVEESGCVIWKLVNHLDGYNYAVVMGFTEMDDDKYDLRIKLARQEEDSILQFEYDRDWEYPCDKDGNVIDFEWDSGFLEDDIDGVLDCLKDSVLPFLAETLGI